MSSDMSDSSKREMAANLSPSGKPGDTHVGPPPGEVKPLDATSSPSDTAKAKALGTDLPPAGGDYGIKDEVDEGDKPADDSDDDPTFRSTAGGKPEDDESDTDSDDAGKGDDGSDSHAEDEAGAGSGSGDAGSGGSGSGGGKPPAPPSGGDDGKKPSGDDKAKKAKSMLDNLKALIDETKANDGKEQERIEFLKKLVADLEALCGQKDVDIAELKKEIAFLLAALEKGADADFSAFISALLELTRVLSEQHRNRMELLNDPALERARKYADSQKPQGA